MSDATDVTLFDGEKRQSVLGFCVARRSFVEACFLCKQTIQAGAYVCVVFVDRKPIGLMGVDSENPPVCPGCQVKKLSSTALWQRRRVANAAVEEYGRKFSEAVKKARAENLVISLGAVFPIVELPSDMTDPRMYSMPE